MLITFGETMNNPIAIANLLTVIVIYISAMIGTTWHYWVSAWWFVLVWVTFQVVCYFSWKKPR